jgi:hypothetical protein
MDEVPLGQGFPEVSTGFPLCTDLAPPPPELCGNSDQAAYSYIHDHYVGGFIS